MKHWMKWTTGLCLGLVAAMPSTAVAAPTATERSTAGKPAAAKPNAAPAAGQSSAPVEEWSVTSVSKDGGVFDYCAAGTRFDNKHALLIAKNKADEVFVIVGLPADKLTPENRTPTKLTVDGRESRLATGFVTQPSALAVPLKKDAPFFEAIRRGNALAIENSDLKLNVSLQGSGKALADLRSCVESSGKSFPKSIPAAAPAPVPAPVPAVTAVPLLEPPPAAAQVATADTVAASPPVSAPAPVPVPAAVEKPEQQVAVAAPPTPPAASPPAPAPEAKFPPQANATPATAVAPSVPAPSATGTPPVPTLPNPLVDLLSTAGMAGVVPVSLDHIPAEKRPANFAWRYGAVFGGIIEVDVLDDRDLDALSNAYLDFLKSTCPGKFASSLGPIEPLREVTMRTGDATCTVGEQTTYFRHVYYVNRARILTLNQNRDFMILIHEGVDQTKDMATKARDLLATAVRQIATLGPMVR